MNGEPELYACLEKLQIAFEYYEHPPAPTVEIAMSFWRGLDATHCKNIFLRNHKGNQHFLVILECHKQVNIRELELQLKQGKLSFASPQRMEKYLGVQPGSVTPFGLIHDEEQHVHLFLDRELQAAKKISFHPNINTASLVIAGSDLFRFLDAMGNSYEFVDL